MALLSSLSDLIENIVPKYAFILNNGTIIKSTIAEENLLNFAGIIPNICEELKIDSFIHKSKLYIYRLTEHFIIFLLTDLEEGAIKPFFSDIYNRYSKNINEIVGEIPKSFNSNIKGIIFSMSTARGPEPICWRSELNEGDIYNISMKAMLTLTGELDGAKEKVISFQPFIQYDALGIIFLFQIPFKTARGNAYDSCITILANYSDRAIIYEKNRELELELDKISYSLANKFKEHADIEGNIATSKIFDKILLELEKSLSNIQLNLNSTK